jgi:hypothetical protein
MKFLWLVLMSSTAFAMFPSDENPYTFIPRETKFDFIYGRNIKLPAGSTSIELAKIEIDSDGDGVPDFADWCPNTHADHIHAVWTKANINNNPEEWIGCSFAGKGEYSLESYNSIPKGIVHTFKLEYNSSFSERILSEDVVFEVLSSGNKLQNGEHDKASILNLVTQKDGMLISMRADTREHTLIGNEVLKKHRGTFYIENNFEPTKKMNIENFKRIFKFITPLPNSIIVR